MGKLSLVFIILFCISCTPEAPQKTNENAYFDLEQYFNSEVARLAARNPTVQKEVIVAGKKEQKS